MAIRSSPAGRMSATSLTPLRPIAHSHDKRLAIHQPLIAESMKGYAHRATSGGALLLSLEQGEMEFLILSRGRSGLTRVQDQWPAPRILVPIIDGNWARTSIVDDGGRLARRSGSTPPNRPSIRCAKRKCSKVRARCSAWCRMRWAPATTHDPAGPGRIHSDARLEVKGENMLGMSGDQDSSLNDAVSLAVKEEWGLQREIEEAIAFNQHFVVAGLCLLPGG